MSRAAVHSDDSDIRWFKSLADVSGVSYVTPHGIDRAALPGHDAVPEVFEYGFEGVERRGLWWSTPDGGKTSASPAQQRAYEDQEEATARDKVRRLREALELPGTVSDYHFAVQQAAETAYKERREDPPALVEEAERLWWLDIELIEAHPRTLEYSPGEFYRVAAYERLARLYEGEGYLHEALEIAERGLGVGQEHLSPAVERLRANLAELEAEEAEA